VQVGDISKKNLEFVYGSSTNIKTSSQDEEVEAGPSGIVGIVQEEEM
jgi:hypothetical protein